jgi:hypothetical protein
MSTKFEKSRWRQVSCVAIAFGLLALNGLTLRAQTYAGSVTGVVTDPAGAVIPAATAVLTDQEKGFTFNASTGPDGRYVFRDLPPGKYSLSVTAPGLSTEQAKGIVLNVGQNSEINFKLQVEGTSQTVEVTSATPLLQTQDASTGQVVNQKFINDLPLISRSVFDLTQLAPGVTQAPNSSFGANTNPVNFISNGGRNSTSDIVIDGVSQTNNENNSGVTTALYTPPVDAVQEFKVEQNTYSADIGFSGNTIVNVITKSGTNRFNGSLYEFLQNNVLNANNWFNNQNRLARSPRKQNLFGGTIGGPIIHDKTFFFFDYQGTRTRSGSTVRAGVPSVAERQGDFAEVCTRAGGAFNSTGLCSKTAGQLWDPYTGVFSSSVNGPVRSGFIPFNNLATYQSPGSPVLAGTPYQAKPVPGNLIDPVAYKMMQYYPLPNVGVGTAGYNPLNNWIGTGGSRSNDDRFDIKIDHRFNESNLLSGRYSRDNTTSEGNNCFGNVADPCTQGPINGDANSASLNFSHTFNPSFLLNLTYGYTRRFSYTAGVAADFPSFNPVTTLGLPQYMLASGFIATPNIQIGNGYQNVSSQALGSQTYSILKYPLDTHDLLAGFDKVAGKHEFKFGYEGRMHRISFLQVGLPEGQFSFNLTGTSQTPASGTGGDALASMLVGFPSFSGSPTGGSYGIDVAVTTQNFAHAWYFQDNWKLSDRLTLNLGLRYELTLPRTERYNRMSWLDPNAASPLQVPGLPSLKGGMDFASSNERSPYDVDTQNFGPRVGLAYRMPLNVVLRTGYGIFFEPIKGAASGTGGGGFTGFNWQTPEVLTYQNNGATPYGRISDPFPGTGPLLPPGNSQGLATGIGLSISDPIRNWNATPYVQTWNFGLEHEFRGDVLLDVNYVGTKGTHLYFGGAGTLDYLGPWVENLSSSQISALNSNVPNPFYGYITNSASSLRNPTVQAYQLLRPYPQYTGFNGNDPPWANSIYNALQMTLEKRLSKGLQVLVTYVYSKSIDDSSVTCGCTTWLGGTTSLQDPNKRFLERAVSQFDIPQVFQFSYTYQFPFGRGKQFGSNWNGVTDAVLGGWQTNGVWRFDDGMPLQLSVSNSRSLPTYGAQRPNLMQTLSRNNGANWMQQYFADPTAAVTPAPFTIGDAPREVSSVRAPGTANATLSLFKQFSLSSLREGSMLEFRIEAFNALNHPQFSAPNLTVGSSAFGQVTSQANSPRQVQLALRFYF